MILPPVLIFEFREGLGKILKQTAENKGMLVELISDFKYLEPKCIPDLIKRNYYKLVIINYKWVKEYKPLDILALVKETKTPYALIYTDSSQEIDKNYEALSYWSFNVTDEHKDNVTKLALDLKEEFSLPPDGSLKFALK